MNSIPKRVHSTTRLDHRSNGLSIYYKRGNADVEEEMMRITVIREGSSKPDDTLRSSKSSESMATDKSWSKKSEKRKKKEPKSLNTRPTSFLKKWREYKKAPLTFVDKDEETMRVLDELNVLNCKIRMRFHIGISPSFEEDMEQLNRDKNNNMRSSSRSSSSASIISTSKAISESESNSFSPVATAEAFDYLGRPLKPLLAKSPFPGACSTKTRKEVNDILERKKSKSTKSDVSSSSASSFIKPPVPPVSHTSSSSGVAQKSATKTPTSSRILEMFKQSKSANDKSEVSTCPTPPSKLKHFDSETKFPNASSPATREKVRRLLKECARKKISKESKSESSGKDVGNILKEMSTEEKKNKKKIKKSDSSSSSLKTIYSKNNMMVGCVDCVTSCARKHPREEEKKKKQKQDESYKSTKRLKSLRSSKKSKKKSKKSKKRKPMKSARSTSSTTESTDVSNKSRKKRRDRMRTEMF